jgi:hypothetical protein
LAGSGAAALLGAATAGVGGLGDDAEGAAGAAAAAATGGGVFCGCAPGGDCATPEQPAVTSRQSSSALIARANCNRELTAILAETDMRDDFDLTARHTGGSTPEAFGVDVRSETTK